MMANETTQRVWWGTSDVMKFLGLCRQDVLRLCEEGKFVDAYRLSMSSRWKIPKESVIAYHDSVKARPSVRRPKRSA